ncbi:kinase-like protein [Aulographum hederae CBS 113979]|uniref:Kinase-like protein n=1 Tax=Aulographum hederae CBS 113979 TaxID=1176131 RepID=A0A6G1GW69_9PEZI|nr:kinase-like protein [Aulographum hederae CBS 113979]
MSTPSTATATLPPHQYYPHQSYQPHLQNYSFNGQLVNGQARLPNTQYSGYNSAASLPGNPDHLRRTATANSNPRPSQQSQQPQQLAYRASPHPADDMSNGKRKPDWNEFYKNGIPKEVILIDDTPEPEAPAAAASSYRPNNTNGATRHADKKRKTTANISSTAYDPVYAENTSYSTTQTPYYDQSSHNTASTDRTASAVNGTAATSLGSHTSSSTLGMDSSVVGQKRKRTRQVANDELKQAKKRDIEKRRDPFSPYVPPPNPPIKAKEVYVPVIEDRHSVKGHKVDDDDGHYIVQTDADLTERYQIIRLLGQGTFGKVVEAFDRKKKTRCAVKVVRSVQKYREASRIEIRVLSTLASNDKPNRNKCIHMRDCFDFRNHICIVTDLYSQSVFDFLKMNSFTPFPSSHIQSFARQLFTSVAFLHDLNLIHTDLKPENILLVKSDYQTFTYNRTCPSSSTSTARTARHRKVLLDPEIRLIDFGSATFNDEYHSSVVSTRHYRAPEIILNLGWSFPCDIWSIGCILVEFFTGDALFQTHDNLEHMAMMEPVCGSKVDREIVRAVTKAERNSSKNPAVQYVNKQNWDKAATDKTHSYFKSSKLDYPNPDTPRASKKYVKAMKKLSDVIPPTTDFNRQFLDLLKKVFVYNPDKRITAKQALKHPWFKESIQDDGTEATKIKQRKELAAQQPSQGGHR